jgi:hypothetical protein
MRRTVLRHLAACSLVLLALNVRADLLDTADPPVRAGVVRADKAIAIVPVPEIAAYQLSLPGSGGALGRLGSLFGKSDAEKRADAVRQKMLERRFVLQDVMTQALQRELAAAGFQVRLRPPGQTMPVAGELVLVTTPNGAGFWADEGQPLRGFVRARVVLYSEDGGTSLRDASHAVGFSPPIGHWLRTPVAGPGLAAYDDLLGRPDQAAAQLQQAADLFARSVARELR